MGILADDHLGAFLDSHHSARQELQIVVRLQCSTALHRDAHAVIDGQRVFCGIDNKRFIPRPHRDLERKEAHLDRTLGDADVQPVIGGIIGRPDLTLVV